MITASDLFEWFKEREGFGCVAEADELEPGVLYSGVIIDGHWNLVELARWIAARQGPSYHSLRLAERFQRDAENFAEGASAYRDLVMTSRVSTMSRALNLRLYREYAAKAADMARRARVLMGVDDE